ncbi:DUF393 domain-containing protein [candidate division KSB1 bacterium]|nr:DUF393 domain-containing protein [candidate division KSB1 bacterium]
MNKMTIIYDGQCGLCQGSITWIKDRALPGQFEFIACQSAERKTRFPEITTGECLSALQLILADRRILSGADAIPEILTGLKGWRWLEKCLRLKPVRYISPIVYSFVAKHRNFLACVL